MSEEKTGIWVDYDKAFIINVANGETDIKMIESNIEHFHILGGSRSKLPYGPQDNVSESKMLARKKQQQKDFFAKIIKALNPAKTILIFGPAEAKIGLKSAISKDLNFEEKNIAVEAADSMTENQMKAWVSNYKI